ncbi:MAG: hypothetical protein V4736_08215 [Bdellovibrionota bacterium]
MEDINPTLWLVLTIKKALEHGESVRSALLRIEKVAPQSLRHEIHQWRLSIEGKGKHLNIRQMSPYRRHAYDLMEKGLKGESIHLALENLETEVISACKREIEERIAKLPFILMIPLMLFQFPALILVSLGPFFIEMMDAIGGQWIG